MLILTVLRGPDKGKLFELPDHEPQLIGRSSEAIQLSDKTISRRHAELTPDEGRWIINDLESANGTFVNGVRLTTPHRLRPGDQVRTGVTLFVFGQEPRLPRQHGVRVDRQGEISSQVEAAVSSNDDAMIAMADTSMAAVLQLRMIYDLTQVIGTIDDRKTLLERVMDLIFEYFQADRGFILLQDDVEEKPEPVVVRHRMAPKEPTEEQITISRTIVQHVINREEGVLSSNAMADKRFADGDSVVRYGIRSAMCVPIKFKDHVLGVIQIDSQVTNYTYTEDHLRLLTAIGIQTGLALANAQHYADRLQRERLAAIGQTVASLSHSIKNILQGLRGGADVVELGLRKKSMKVVRGGWEIIARNLDRIIGLTTNMLAFSKQHHPELELIHLPMLLEEAVTLVQKQFENKRIALITDMDQQMPPIPIDPVGIHQALLNLLNNALDAVEPQSGLVSLRCEYDEDAWVSRIVVHDNGPGINPQTRKHLFEPFQSTKGLRGTGLGLVVTKKIIEEHGGKIQVDSSPENGTSFTLILPCARNTGTTSAETHGTAPQSPKAASFWEEQDGPGL